jgi:hypothetical protein
MVRHQLIPVEELAALGVRLIVDLAWLATSWMPCQRVPRSGLVTDGTSRAHTIAAEAMADAELAQRLSPPQRAWAFPSRV